MAIVPIISRGSESNCYLVLDQKNLLIDSGAGIDEAVASQVESALAGRKLDLIVNTHAHYDHCAGDDRFEGAKVHIHRDDAKELLSGSFYGTYQFFGDEHPIKFNKLLEGGDKLELGEHVLEVIHTPGHTHGSICLLDKDAGALFSGDTLFANGGFGRFDMGGDGRQIIQSLEKLARTRFQVLYPGHGPVVSDGKRQAELSLDNARMFASR